MTKQEFKIKVLNWIKENGINLTKKVRVYNTRRYGFEVRIYNEPVEFLNKRRSRRKMPVDEFGNNCMVGIFNRKVSTYVHINEDDFKSEEEKAFILEMLNN